MMTAVSDEKRDRRATPREIRALDRHRRAQGVILTVLQEPTGMGTSTLSELLSGYRKDTMLSDLRRIRAAIDEIVSQAKA